MNLPTLRIRRVLMALIFDFRKITEHGQLKDNGRVFARTMDIKLSASTYTVVGLELVDGIVISQFTVLRGDYCVDNFVGMCRFELMRWSDNSGTPYNFIETNEIRELANGGEESNPKKKGTLTCVNR